MKDTETNQDEVLPEQSGTIDESLVDGILGEYEKRPYPAEDERVLSQRAWKLAPLGWWNGTGRLAAGELGRLRVLVAGCGTGNEAFNFARLSEEFEVVGVDFSRRSIEVAERWKTASGLKNVSFVQADLSADDFGESVDGPFDLVSCHGVISYVPETVAALRNLESVLADDGALYLGCNGSTHVSQQYRPVLGRLGCDLESYEADSTVRQKVALCDDLKGLKPGKGIANQSDGFIASDIFGKMNLCHSLEEWNRKAEEAGLVFLGALQPTRLLSQIHYNSTVGFLREEGVRWAQEASDRMRPTPFHRVLYGKGGRRLPDFSIYKQEELKEWRPFVNLWKRDAIPPMKKPFTQKVSFKLNIPGLYKDHAIEARAFVLEFLRLSDGEKTLGGIVGEIGSGVTVEQMIPLLFRFHLCGMVNLKPPAS